jgi:uncharacterized membrane protein
MVRLAIKKGYFGGERKMDSIETRQKEEFGAYRKVNRVVSWIIFPPLMLFSFIAIFTGHLWLISKRGLTEMDGIWARVIGGVLVLLVSIMAIKWRSKNM